MIQCIPVVTDSYCFHLTLIVIRIGYHHLVKIVASFIVSLVGILHKEILHPNRQSRLREVVEFFWHPLSLVVGLHEYLFLYVHCLDQIQIDAYLGHHLLDCDTFYPLTSNFLVNWKEGLSLLHHHHRLQPQCYISILFIVEFCLEQVLIYVT